MKKVIKGIAFCFMFILLNCTIVFAMGRTGWTTDNGRNVFFYDGNIVKNMYVSFQGNVYFCDANGTMDPSSVMTKEYALAKGIAYVDGDYLTTYAKQVTMNDPNHVHKYNQSYTFDTQSSNYQHVAYCICGASTVKNCKYDGSTFLYLGNTAERCTKCNGMHIIKRGIDPRLEATQIRRDWIKFQSAIH